MASILDLREMLQRVRERAPERLRGASFQQVAPRRGDGRRGRRGHPRGALRRGPQQPHGHGGGRARRCRSCSWRGGAEAAPVYLPQGYEPPRRSALALARLVHRRRSVDEATSVCMRRIVLFCKLPRALHSIMLVVRQPQVSTCDIACMPAPPGNTARAGEQTHTQTHTPSSGPSVK